MSEPEVRWLTEPEMLAWLSLVEATTSVLAVLDNELQAEHDLSLGDYQVLHYLSQAPDGAQRMSELAAQLHLSPSGITRRIDGLVRTGFVERRPCPSDRRGSNAVLTALGVKMLATAAPTHVRGVRAHFVDRLTAAQLAGLAQAMAAIDVDDESAAGGCDTADALAP
jgi:DNA-binding MarR family transcriptional regulator